MKGLKSPRLRMLRSKVHPNHDVVPLVSILVSNGEKKDINTGIVQTILIFRHKSSNAMAKAYPLGWSCEGATCKWFNRFI